MATTTTRVRVVTPAGVPPPLGHPPTSPPNQAPVGQISTGILHWGVRVAHPKGEDTVSITRRQWPDENNTHAAPRLDYDGEAHPLADTHYALFAVFDGHNGRAAAAFAEAHTADAVHAALPGPPPRGALDGRCACAACAADDEDGENDAPVESDVDDTACAWRHAVAAALASAVAATHAAFAATGGPGGTTATLVLTAGRLVTVANVGDSAAFIDSGGGALLRLTADHRVASSRSEAARVRADGGLVAAVCPVTGGGPSTARDGVGLAPLRAWTADGRGGFANARALGDLDACNGAPVTSPAPALTQVLLPKDGGRVLLASDGVWDAVPPHRAARAARPLGPPEAAEAVVGAVLRAAGPGGVPRDDATIVVVDVLPSGTAPSFPEAVGWRMRRSASRGAALAALAAASAVASADGEADAQCAPPLLPVPASPPKRRGLAALFKLKPRTPPTAAPPTDPPGGVGLSLRNGRTPDTTVRSGGTGSSGRGGFFAELARSVRGGTGFALGARPTMLARLDLVTVVAGDDAAAAAAATCGYSSDDESRVDDDNAAAAAAAGVTAALAADGVLIALLKQAVHDAPGHHAAGRQGGLTVTPAQLVEEAVAAASVDA